MVCRKDYLKWKGVYLALHHTNYRNLGHEIPGDLVPLCKVHHPVGAYSMWAIKRDRKRYLTMKYSVLLVTLPLQWVTWIYSINSGKLFKEEYPWRKYLLTHDHISPS